MKKFYRHLVADICIFLLIYTFSTLMHQGEFFYSFSRFLWPGLIYFIIHIVISLGIRKYETDDTNYGMTKMVRLYGLSWLKSTGLILLIIVVWEITWISRQVLLLHIFGLLILEMIMVGMVQLIRYSDPLPDPDEIDASRVVDVAALYPPMPGILHEVQKSRVDTILKRESRELHELISRYIDLYNDHTLALYTDNYMDVQKAQPDYYESIINLHKLNNMEQINFFIQASNSRLPNGGVLVVNIETQEQRKIRLLEKYPHLLNYIYYIADFIVMRIFPKMPGARKIYFWLTKGNKRVISHAEILGRLYAGGFEMVSDKEVDGRYFVISRKVKPPIIVRHNNYGPLIYLNRVGLGGEMIKVYKLRTMHPYSEFLQEFIYQQHKLKRGGKFNNDFRVATWGRFLRKYWIDELPMLINLFRGELKLVGVRPVSSHYFSLYSPEMQERRSRHNPGLIPPFYKDLPDTLEEIHASELRYMEAYEKAPLKTDLSYLAGALFNIVFRNARSR